VLAGAVAGLVVGLVFVNHDALKLTVAWPIVLGFALRQWVGPRGSRAVAAGAAAIAGALLGWVAFAVPAEYLPVTDLSLGIVSGALVAVMVAGGIVARERFPLPAMLVGFAAFFGAFWPRWQQSPSNFRSHGLEDLTVVWLGLLVGVLASAVIRAVTDRAVAPVPGGRMGDDEEPSASQTAAAGEETLAAATASESTEPGVPVPAARARSRETAPAPVAMVERVQDHNGSLLSIDGLTCSYGPVVALRDVVLHVKAGEVVCVLGVNGAGKTTLLSSIAGMVKPLRGSIVLNGKNVAGRRAEEVVRDGVALVPEGRQVFPTMSVRDNLLIGAYAGRRNQDSARRTLDEIHELFPVLERAGSRPAGSLSGGEQQMLAIGRALMSQPRLLMLDEPSLGLAPTVVERVMEVVGQLAKGDRGVLLVEQLARIALTVADRGYLLERGSVVLAGPSADLQADQRVQEIYMGIRR
jgi:branched-chain amino acid transport system ATP-binding protein